MSREILLRTFTNKNKKRDGVYGENDFDDGGKGFVKS